MPEQNEQIEQSAEFKEKKPKTNFNPVGRSGTFVTGYEVQDDYINDLNGPSAQVIYDKMLRSDSQIRKVYHAVNNPIKSALWAIEPASDDAKDLEIAALMQKIIFEDIEGGFQDKLDEILVFPWRGHSIFEVVHKNRYDKNFGFYTGLENLAYRESKTIDQWHFDQTGKLKKIHQLQQGDIHSNVYIPREDLLIFFNEKKGDDTGFPFCRMIYGNYKRKLLYKELQAIGIERAAIPVPHLELPATVEYNSEEYLDAADQLAAFTQAEQSFFITPEGYKLNYNQTGTYDPAKVQVAIKAENEEISGSIVAMWLEMGIGGNSAVGSSTGESLKFFTSGIEYIANKISKLINSELIPSLVALNFPEMPETLPKLVHSGISEEAGKELMEIVTGYVSSGIIQTDEMLEDHVRKVHKLPKKAEGEAIDNQEANNGEENTAPDSDDSNDDSGDTLGDQEPSAEVVELSSKKKPLNPKQLINLQSPSVKESLQKSLRFASDKFIVDTINRYKQLPEAKKQKATATVKMAGINTLKKDLKRNLTDTTNKSINMAKQEVPTKSDIELKNVEREMERFTLKYGEHDYKLNEKSKLPSHMQVLIATQADLISEASYEELKNRLSFSYSSAELRTQDPNVIKQAMEQDADDYINSNQVNTKATNVTALMVNEGRDTFFFQPEVLDEIHSFTFVNYDPKSAICKELAGTTFNTNDAESMRYTPPLHHNCKSYLRANLKSSKGADRLEISTLSPTAKAKKSITL